MEEGFFAFPVEIERSFFMSTTTATTTEKAARLPRVTLLTHPVSYCVSAFVQY